MACIQPLVQRAASTEAALLAEAQCHTQQRLPGQPNTRRRAHLMDTCTSLPLLARGRSSRLLLLPPLALLTTLSQPIILLSAATYARADDTTMSSSAPWPARVGVTVCVRAC